MFARRSTLFLTEKSAPPPAKPPPTDGFDEQPRPGLPDSDPKSEENMD